MPRRSLLKVMLAVAALAAGFAMPGRAAHAGEPPDPIGEVGQSVARARLSHEQAVLAVHRTERRFADLARQHQQILVWLDQAAADVVRAELEQRVVTQQLTMAQDMLNQRAAAAYMAGPGASWELFLGSRTPAGYLSAREFAARTFAVDQQIVDRVGRTKRALEALTQRLLRRQRDLRADAEHLQTLDGQMAEQLTQAQAVARTAGLTLGRLQAQQRELVRQRAEAASRLRDLIDPTKGIDQSPLLALLGPTEGRGCAIPSTLEDTDTHLSGLASWYGWDQAGSPTSSGAVFDPRLFTAANKELPLNVFLRVRFRDRCAIVLVNDRGPFGLGRSFDLSQAAAQYLRYQSAGVVPVSADVLVPRDPIPVSPAP